MTQDGGSSSNLPTASLKLDAETLALIDTSKVKKLIGRLIVKAHERRAQTIAVLTWDNDDLAASTARIVASALSQQVDRRCALISIEGIRFNCENYDALSVITVPELELSMVTEQGAAFINEINANYPFQVLIGPSIKSWNELSVAKSRIVLNAGAHLLAVPASGVPRAAVERIRRFTEEHKIKWLGTIAIEENKQ